MNEIIQNTKDVTIGLLEQLKNLLETNTEVSVVVIFTIFLIVVILAFKELFDIATGSNKKALKFHNTELNARNFELESKYKILNQYYQEILDHNEALISENKGLKATAFDEMFSAEDLAKICQPKIFDAVDVNDITPKVTQMGDDPISH